MTPTLSAVLAEDEALLRQFLKKKLEKLWPELTIVGEAEDGVAAVELIATLKPSVAFLDIRMPEMTGLEVATQIAEAAPDTHIVFVTAFHEYAVAAFERGAVDYVLKPIEEARLNATIARLRERIASDDRDAPTLPDNLAQLVATLKRELRGDASTPHEFMRWIKASLGPTLKLIDVKDVLFFNSDEKYTRVVTESEEALIRKPLRELLGELDPNSFWQIHRGTIVNVNAIAGVTRDFRGDATVKVKGHKEALKVSRPFSHLFKQM
ncbi:MAG: response regulator transcription factor [Burkholderiales bacterium]|nr:response regulator transcription factor [Pseudomonadota bacterium]MCC7067579.1 response regulator transcription factor [Burkholderiales bacterium]MCZ2133882.1 LytTR family DNA-binding domain-containing protein [Burkholderiales bacterium]